MEKNYSFVGNYVVEDTEDLRLLKLRELISERENNNWFVWDVESHDEHVWYARKGRIVQCLWKEELR